MTTLMAFLKNRTVQQLVIFTACQNSLWWLAGSTVNTGSPLTTLVKFYLLMYGGLLAAGVFLILNHHFQSRIGPVLVVAAATMGFLAAPNAHLVQFFALLICLFLVLVCLPQLGLQSVYGLVVLVAWLVAAYQSYCFFTKSLLGTTISNFIITPSCQLFSLF
ncbi:hypothetical protein [Levilactobacillus brevis]|uniref:hypothetical protein n=1 Tax=Levilactobacillus brevis TaxID=1580 RepID=UPI0005B6AFE9|nr:hypothetical protein [Levilactobacillus brevis]KIO93895.1 hypothetical protein N627_2187 [Levilactobacillus brevis]